MAGDWQRIGSGSGNGWGNGLAADGATDGATDVATDGITGGLADKKTGKKLAKNWQKTGKIEDRKKPINLCIRDPNSTVQNHRNCESFFNPEL